MTTFSTVAALTITTVSIADGAGRKSANVDNSTNKYQKIHWYARFKSGSVAPTADSIITIYAWREDNHATEYVTDGDATTDSALSSKPENAQPIGSIVFTATANKSFYGEGIWRDPGPGGWAIGFFNETGQTLSTTEADGFIHWVGEKA